MTSPKKQDFSWPQVVLGLGSTITFFTAVIVLEQMGIDSSQVLATVVMVLVTVLGALGYRQQNQIDTKIDQVREVSNGRLSEALRQNREKDERISELQTQITSLALRVLPERSDNS